MIQFWDNCIGESQLKTLYEMLLYKVPYYYGETDSPGQPPQGLVSHLPGTLEQQLIETAAYYMPDLKDRSLQRSYLNLFRPEDKPYFHTDGPVLTCMFYINEPCDFQDLGETQFYVDDKITGVLPKPGRMIVFDGELIHRATAFRDKPRITVVLKFNK